MGRYALLIGTGRHRDAAFADLTAPAEDVLRLSEVLADPDLGGFEVTTLVDVPAERLRREILMLTEHRSDDDVILLYFSCHGVLDVDGRLFFVASDTEQSSLSAITPDQSFVNYHMSRSLACGRVLLLDCCFSGAFIRNMKTAKRQITESFDRSYVVITGTDEHELASAQTESGMSVFTAAVVEGIETGAADLDADGEIDTDDLYKYLDRVIPGRAAQTPVRRVDGAGTVKLANVRQRPEPGVIRATWIFESKRKGSLEGYRVLANSSAGAKDTLAERLAAHRPDLPERIGDAQPPVLPWVTIMPVPNSAGTLDIGMSVTDQSGDYDGTGTAIISVRYLEFPFDHMSAATASYSSLWATIRGRTFRNGQPLGFRTAQQDSQQLVEDIESAVWHELADAVDMLLAEYYEFSISDAGGVDKALVWCDSIVALLPYGMRSALSLGRWPSHARGSIMRLEWVTPPQGSYRRTGGYRDLLSACRERYGARNVVEHLLSSTEPVGADRDHAWRILAALDAKIAEQVLRPPGRSIWLGGPEVSAKRLAALSRVRVGHLPEQGDEGGLAALSTPLGREPWQSPRSPQGHRADTRLGPMGVLPTEPPGLTAEPESARAKVIGAALVPVLVALALLLQFNIGGDWLSYVYGDKPNVGSVFCPQSQCVLKKDLNWSLKENAFISTRLRPSHPEASKALRGAIKLTVDDCGSVEVAWLISANGIVVASGILRSGEGTGPAEQALNEAMPRHTEALTFSARRTDGTICTATLTWDHAQIDLHWRWWP